MNLKIPAALRMAIRWEAKANGMLVNTYLEWILTEAVSKGMKPTAPAKNLNTGK